MATLTKCLDTQKQMYRTFITYLITSYLKLLVHTEALNLSWKLTEWRTDYSAALCVWVCDATHTVLDSSMDKRLYLFPSVVTQTQMHTHTERSSRGICEQQSMLKATLSKPWEIIDGFSVPLSVYNCMSKYFCTHYKVLLWKMMEWRH